ncbi:zinc ribbon domain-containing protein [Actinomadura kijaniata]|uniref:Putative FmdB family regulatory protein n=1 Tax=Actinomadura namibiensis TaxID=182080 RepID=A0A7W3LS96_ACTNM|nr:zinc ribbon domain-containing protein [Actinomadura namibiensis]MBA8953389.1 putative FmdB family regulatory protein [Actinomadura namibiensis]
MVAYEYRCRPCGPFTVRRPMGRAPADAPCPHCGGTAPRAFTAPAVPRTSRALARALDAQKASAHEPRVVDRVPPRAPSRVPPASSRVLSPGSAPADPRHSRLPRP